MPALTAAALLFVMSEEAISSWSGQQCLLRVTVEFAVCNPPAIKLRNLAGLCTITRRAASVVFLGVSACLRHAGPTGLDMLAASYDTDQASDPPTPRAEVQPPPAAAGGDALLAAAGDPTAGAAAASTIDGSSAAAQPAVAAAASEADGAAVEAQPQSSEPQGHPGFPAAAVAPPLAAALPAATQAIMNKLIGFVKVRQVPEPFLLNPESFPPEW